MYSQEDIKLLSSIDPAQLRGLTVPNQAQIKAQLGEPLDLLQAWKMLKSNTQNWEEPPPESQQSIKLLSQLLQGLGIGLPAKAESNPSTPNQREDAERVAARYRMAMRAKAKLKALQLKNIL